MTSKTQLAKIQNHASLLLSAFLGLRLNYGLLAPLLGDPGLPVYVPPPGQLLNGLSALRNTLFFSCVLDVVKLSWDEDRRTPSAMNIVHVLRKPEFVRTLKDNPPYPFVIPRESNDAMYEESLRQIEAGRRAEREFQIDDQIGELLQRWTAYDNDVFKPAFTELRDKHIAHLEIRVRNGIYEPINVNELQVVRADLGRAIRDLADIVVLLNQIVADAEFAMPEATRAFDEHGQRFWERLFRQ